MKTKSNYIEGLIEQGENQFLDFKFAINDSKKIARSLVSFSNSYGGRLLIGVKDNGTIAGIRTEEEYYMIQGAAELYCKPKIEFETKDWTVQGKKVLEVIVPQSNEKPHMARGDDNKWLAYIRVDDENIVANSVVLKVWQKLKSENGIRIKNPEPGNKLLKYLNSNQYITLSGFLKLSKIPYQTGIHILSDFIVLGLIDYSYSNKQFIYKSKENINH